MHIKDFLKKTNRLNTSTRNSNLFSSSALYAISMLLAKAAGFLLLPFYTSYISPADYGILSMLDLIGTYLAIVVSGGLNSAYMRFYHKKEDAKWRGELLATIMSLNFLIGLFMLVLTAIFVPVFASAYFDDSSYINFIYIIAITIVIESSISCVLTLIRLEDNAKKYLLINVLRLAIAIPLNIYFIAFLKIGILGFIIANLISSTLLMLLFVIPTVYQKAQRPKLSLVKELFSFSWPYIPTSGLEALINNLGIICISMTGQMKLVGLFALGNKLGSIISVIGSPVNTAWTPHMYKIAKELNAAEQYARTTTYVFTFLFIFVTFIGSFAPEIVAIASDSAYQGAEGILLPIAIGSAFFIFRPSTRVGLTLANKTKIFPLLTLIPLIIGFPITYYLSIRYGAVGAAWGCCLVLIGVIISTALYSNKYLAVPYEIIKIIKMIALSVVIILAIRYLFFEQLIIKIILFTLYLLLLPITGIFKWKQISKLVTQRDL